MRVLVANLGSTSFKFKLLDMSTGGTEVARGGYERIGQAGGDYATHGDVIDVILKTLPAAPDAVGFKAVHGGPISGAVRVTDDVIATMEQFSDVAPAHNPPYIAAMRAFAAKLPGCPQVAAFETAFHQTIPASRQVYAIPHEWTETLGVRRYGFHGASHRYIGTRVPELVGEGRARRVISCHLGGSSSVCAILDGKSVANSFGMTAQSGLPQNNRVGDFDTFALLKLLKTGLTLDEIFAKLGKGGGLLGMSGVSNDMRDIEKAAAEGNTRARLAIDAYVEAVRGYVGQYMVALGGVDVLAFTGGIGENGSAIRAAICRDLEWAGLKLDPQKNGVRAKEEKISAT
ncbi:MAG: acetate kinase, partial [Phycisphaerales bacterium]|nr:acetate kinase [Phycisphaerales bacterium]